MFGFIKYTEKPIYSWYTFLVGLPVGIKREYEGRETRGTKTLNLWRNVVAVH